MMLEERPIGTIDATCISCTNKNKGTYTLPGRCSNCGREYVVVMSKGHDKPSGYSRAPCPHCGCSAVGC